MFTRRRPLHPEFCSQKNMQSCDTVCSFFEAAQPSSSCSPSRYSSRLNSSSPSRRHTNKITSALHLFEEWLQRHIQERFSFACTCLHQLASDMWLGPRAVPTSYHCRTAQSSAPKENDRRKLTPFFTLYTCYISMPEGSAGEISTGFASAPFPSPSKEIFVLSLASITCPLLGLNTMSPLGP